MLQRALSSLNYRAKWARLGVFYGKSPKLDHVWVGGRRIELSFPPPERSMQEQEFEKIVFDDRYRLSKIPGEVTTVLDIGANIGLFAIAARRFFPKATVHCYEPNPVIFSNLEAHCFQADCEYFPAAVGQSDGKVSLNRSDSGTLFSTTASNASGAIEQVSFAKTVARLGGEVDLVKLNCEGAEWDIFHDREAWQGVQHLVMEYHLWALGSATTSLLKGALFYLGFNDVEIFEDGPEEGLAFATRKI